MKFFYVLFLIPSILCAQKKPSFKIVGNSSFYNEQDLLIQGGVFSGIYLYNDFNFESDKVDSLHNPYKLLKIQRNKFTITGTQKYPHPFSISYYDAEKNMGISSYFFFIDSGTVNIEVNDLTSKKNLGNRINSKSNKEYQHLKKLYCNSVDTLTGLIHDLKAKQKTIKRYIIQRPNSYVALWDMVIDYAINKCYRNDIDLRILLKNARLLSPTIKKSRTYQALVKSINQDLKLSSGKMFPNILFDSLEIVEEKKFPNIPLNTSDSLIPIIKKNKFTLLDFWFSYCKPCIEQFPRYKDIYALNRNNGFEIIGVSVDRKEDEMNWQKAIQKNNLNWLQYLDRNGITAQQLNIQSFPTNYLLDSNGKILKKNISLEDLEIFLKRNLDL